MAHVVKADTICYNVGIIVTHIFMLIVMSNGVDSPSIKYIEVLCQRIGNVQMIKVIGVIKKIRNEKYHLKMGVQKRKIGVIKKIRNENYHLKMTEQKRNENYHLKMIDADIYLHFFFTFKILTFSLFIYFHFFHIQNTDIFFIYLFSFYPSSLVNFFFFVLIPILLIFRITLS